MSEIKRALRFALWLARTRNLFWSSRLARAEVRPTAEITVDRTGGLRIMSELFRLPPTCAAVSLLENVAGLTSLARAGAEFREAAPWNQVILEKTTFNIFDAQSIQIIGEVFANGIYAVNCEQPVVVVDIGMNVGIASLWFAANLKCPVFAYEPFSDTYDRAMANFSSNPALAAMITARNFGLGETPRDVEATYCPESAGDCGLDRIPDSYRRGRPVKTVTIRVEDVAVEIERIIETHPERAVIAKIDCEGSEYEIIRSLAKRQLLGRLAAVVMEWHRRAPDHEPDWLVQAFLMNGFTVFGRPSKVDEVGMLRAVRIGPMTGSEE